MYRFNDNEQLEYGEIAWDMKSGMCIYDGEKYISYSDFPKRTYKELCELISQHWKETAGIEVSGERIFNYSPTGELTNISFWGLSAELYFKDHTI